MLEQNVDFAVYTKTTPDKDGYFGKYGGDIYSAAVGRRIQ